MSIIDQSLIVLLFYIAFFSTTLAISRYSILTL